MAKYSFNLKKLLFTSFSAVVLMLAVTSNVFATPIYENESDNNLISSATIIPNSSIGQELDASIGYATDSDYFKFTPVNSGGYNIEITGISSLCAVLYDSNQNVIDKLSLYDQIAVLIGELTANNTYYIKFYSSYPTDYGNYSFNVNLTRPFYDEIEPNNLFSTASTLPFPSDSVFGKTISASIETSDDYDIYKFVPDASGSYTFESTGIDLIGFLYNSEYKFLAGDNNTSDGKNFNFICSLIANQTYYLHVDAPSNGSGKYSIKVLPPKTLGMDIEGNNISTARSIQYINGEYVKYKGAINAQGDADFFKFTTSSSGYYTLKCNSFSDVYGAMYDSNCRLMDLMYDDGDIHNMKMEALLEANKVYYLKLRSPGDKTGNYNLEISKGRMLNVPKYIQMPYDNLCWATDYAMVISYLKNDSVNRTLDIAKTQARFERAGDNYIYPSYFNKPKILQDIAHTIPNYVSGITCLDFAHTNAMGPFRSLTFDDVKNRIDNSYPIITLIGWKSTGGAHFEVITGYFEKNNVQYIVYNDPLALDGKEIAMPFADYLNNPIFELRSYLILREPITNQPIPNTDYDLDYSDRFETLKDNDETCGAAEVSSIGATISGSIGLNGDLEDYYRIVLPSENKNITIGISGPTDTVVGLYKSTPDKPSLITEVNNQSSINYVLEPFYGNYYVKVSNSSNAGSYTLNISYSTT